MSAIRQAAARLMLTRSTTWARVVSKATVFMAVFALCAAPVRSQLVSDITASPAVGPVQTPWPSTEGVSPTTAGSFDAAPPPPDRISGRLAPLTFAGAFAGSYLGQRVAITASLQSAGAGAAGVASLLVLSTAGSVLGSATGGTILTGHMDERTLKRAAGGALIGTALGLVGGFIGVESSGHWQGWLVGYALGQATATTLAVHGG